VAQSSCAVRQLCYAAKRYGGRERATCAYVREAHIKSLYLVSCILSELTLKHSALHRWRPQSHNFVLGGTSVVHACMRESKNLTKNQRRQTRRTYTDFHQNSYLREALPELDSLLARDFTQWTADQWLEQWTLVNTLHLRWRIVLNDNLQKSKQERRQKQIDRVFSAPLNSKARRAYHLTHKNTFSTLPSVMKHPDNGARLVTGQAVNEFWGSSAAATRPNTMPDTPTELGTPPWLATSLWKDIRSRISSLEKQLMMPITESELRCFLQNTGRSAPGLDGIQYDVLRFMYFDKSMKDLQLTFVVLRFLNIIIKQKKMPAKMKEAMLTFIYKSGGPLQNKNYRGISLLSCMFKLVTGTLNGRL
jgi:hypothetical protein